MSPGMARKQPLLSESEFLSGTWRGMFLPDKGQETHTHSRQGAKHHILTETVVSIMCQAEAIIACAPVISRDVDALVDTAAVVLGRALVHIYEREREREMTAKDFRGSSRNMEAISTSPAVFFAFVFYVVVREA